MNMLHEKSRHIIAAIFAATFAGTSMAANYWWTGAEDRLFGNVNNWRKDNATTGSVPTTIPASDAVRFMAMSGSTSVFDDRFKNDDYIVEFDKAYTNTWQLYVNTGGAKLTWQGTGSNPSYTFTRPAYNTSVVMGIGDTTDSTIRIEDMVYAHSYTNLVLGWTNGKKGNLEIGSGATVSIPSTAVCCDGLWMRYGSSLLIDGGTLDCGKNIRIGVAANSLVAGKNVISNLNGTVTASWFGVGCKNTHGEYIQKGGSLSTTDHIFITHDWTKGSGYFEVDGGEVTAGTTTNKNIYVGHKGYNDSSAHLVVTGDSEVNCSTLIIGEKSPGIADIKGGIVRAINECRLFSKITGNDYKGNDDDIKQPRLNLIGGVLETPRIKSESTNSYSTVFFNGGTLRESKDNDTILKASDRMYVKVGANGGTIDTAGFTTTVSENIETGVDGGTDGGMTFTGGGTLALHSTASLSYTGDTKVVPGTTLSIPAKNKIDLKKFVCLADAIPDAGVERALLTIAGSDTFTQSDLSTVRIANGKYPSSSVRLKLSSDGKSIQAKRRRGFIISFH